MPALTWIGKDAVMDYHQRVPLRMLKVQPELAFGAREPLHELIEGDNVEAMRALMPHYKGRVKCVYIDPPYNTGNEGWVYNDRVNSPAMQKWLAQEVGRDDLSRHDKWLCMMFPRLVLLRELLDPAEGSIWISIDDNEVHNLRHLMDEVFGPERFVACNVWQKRYSRENREAIGDVHEYVMTYAMSPGVFKTSRNRVPLDEKSSKVYKNPNNDPRGRWRSIPMTAQAGHATPDQFYEIVTPGGKTHKPPTGRCWGIIRTTYEKFLAEGRIYFGKTNNGQPNIIRYLSEVEGLTPWTWWNHEEVGHTDEAKKEVTAILGDADAFDTPKPVRLLERIIQIASNPGDLVLDVFAGTGTTGHAVMKLNAANAGQPPRRCVLVQLGVDQQDGPNIARSVGRERLARVSKGYTTPKGQAVPGLDQGWVFKTLGEPIVTPEGRPRSDLPMEDLAPIVFWHATGQPLAKVPKRRAFLGTSAEGVGVYLLYNGDMEDKDNDSGNVLTRSMLARLVKHDGPRVVYGAACRISGDELRRQKITFRLYQHALAEIAS